MGRAPRNKQSWISYWWRCFHELYPAPKPGDHLGTTNLALLWYAHDMKSPPLVEHSFREVVLVLPRPVRMTGDDFHETPPGTSGFFFLHWGAASCKLHYVMAHAMDMAIDPGHIGWARGCVFPGLRYLVRGPWWLKSIIKSMVTCVWGDSAGYAGKDVGLGSQPHTQAHSNNYAIWQNVRY